MSIQNPITGEWGGTPNSFIRAAYQMLDSAVKKLKTIQGNEKMATLAECVPYVNHNGHELESIDARNDQTAIIRITCSLFHTLSFFLHFHYLF